MKEKTILHTKYGVSQTKKYCVYAHTSLDTGKKYIGTTANIEKRWDARHYQMKKIASAISEAATLHNCSVIDAFKDFFSHEILFESNDYVEVGLREAYYTGKFDTYDNGLNGGIGGEFAQYGVVVEDEHKVFRVRENRMTILICDLFLKIKKLVGLKLWRQGQQIQLAIERFLKNNSIASKNDRYLEKDTPASYWMTPQSYNKTTASYSVSYHLNVTSLFFSEQYFLDRIINDAVAAKVKSVTLKYVYSPQKSQAYYRRFSSTSFKGVALPKIRQAADRAVHSYEATHHEPCPVSFNFVKVN